MTTPEAKAREMTQLDVHEISIVDRPAIRRVFLAKRDDTDVPTDPDEAAVLALFKRDGYEIFKSEAPQPAEIVAALGNVIPMLRRMAERLPPGSEDKLALTRAAALMAQLQGGTMPLPNDPNANVPPKPPMPGAKPAPPMPMSDEEKAKALAMEEKEKALFEKEKLLAEKEKALAALEDPTKQKKTKSVDEDEPYAMLTPSGIVPVAKGRKMLTEDRTKMLTDAFVATAKALAEVAGAEVVKMAFADVLNGAKELPEGKVPGQGVTPMGEGKPVLKAEIQAALSESLGALNARLATIEKSLGARTPSAVTPAEGDGKPVTKSTSLFAGIL